MQTLGEYAPHRKMLVTKWELKAAEMQMIRQHLGYNNLVTMHYLSVAKI